MTRRLSRNMIFKLIVVFDFLVFAFRLSDLLTSTWFSKYSNSSTYHSRFSRFSINDIVATSQLPQFTSVQFRHSSFDCLRDISVIWVQNDYNILAIITIVFDSQASRTLSSRTIDFLSKGEVAVMILWRQIWQQEVSKIRYRRYRDCGFRNCDSRLCVSSHSLIED